MEDPSTVFCATARHSIPGQIETMGDSAINKVMHDRAIYKAWIKSEMLFHSLQNSALSIPWIVGLNKSGH